MGGATLVSLVLGHLAIPIHLTGRTTYKIFGFLPAWIFVVAFQPDHIWNIILDFDGRPMNQIFDFEKITLPY